MWLYVVFCLGKHFYAFCFDTIFSNVECFANFKFQIVNIGKSQISFVCSIS